MSSRLTTPVSKLTRAFSTTPSIARPSHLLNNASKAAAAPAATGAGRKPSPLLADEDSTHTRNHSTTTTTPPHRPKSPSRRLLPLMQPFHHSAPKPLASPAFTVDRTVLPDPRLFESGGGGADSDPYARIRVPLLPDNASPPAGLRAPEAADAPLPRPEIVVVAGAGPAAAAALTEVEGMGVDGVELGFAHLVGEADGAGRGGYDEMGSGMIRDLWKGLVDDVFGGGGSVGAGAGKGGPAAAAA